MDTVKKLFFSGSIYLIGSLLERALPLLFLPLYTDALSVEDFGVLSILSLMVVWPEKFVSAPIGNGITRHYYEPNYISDRGSLIFSGYLFTFVQSLIFGALILIFSDTISLLLLDNVDYADYVSCFAIVMIFRPISNLMASLARIQNNAKLYVVINVLVHASAAIIQLILLIIFNLGIMSMIVGAIYISVMTTILYVPNTRKIIQVSFDWLLLKDVLIFGYPLIIAAVVALGTQTLDRIWVLKYLDLAAVGVLAIAYKIPLILDFTLSIPMKQALVPVIYEMENVKERQKLFVRTATSHITVFVVFCTLFLSMSSLEIISLLTSGDDYLKAAQLAPFLLISSASQALALVFGYGLAMEKKTLLISYTSVLVLIMYLISLSFFLPIYGLIGVGIASAIAYTFRNVIRGYLSYKYYGQTWELQRILIIVFIGLIFYWFSSFISIHNIFLSLLIKSGVSLLFVITIYSGLVLSFKDVKLIYFRIFKTVN